MKLTCECSICMGQNPLFLPDQACLEQNIFCCLFLPRRYCTLLSLLPGDVPSCLPCSRDILPCWKLRIFNAVDATSVSFWIGLTVCVWNEISSMHYLDFIYFATVFLIIEIMNLLFVIVVIVVCHTLFDVQVVYVIDYLPLWH